MTTDRARELWRVFARLRARLASGAGGVQANSFTSLCVTRGVSAASKKSSTLSLPPNETLGAGVRLGFACCGAAFFSMFVTSVRARRRLALGVAVVAMVACAAAAVSWCVLRRGAQRLSRFAAATSSSVKRLSRRAHDRFARSELL